MTVGERLVGQKRINKSANDSQASLLGARFDSLVGYPVVSMTERGESARKAVIVKVTSREWAQERAPCLCGQAGGRLLAKIDRYGIPQDSLLCMHCGLVRCDPRMDGSATMDFYRNFYRAIYERRGHSLAIYYKMAAREAGKRFQWIVSSIRDPAICRASIWEIGCGGGWNLLPWQQAGAQVRGYDFDEEYLQSGIGRGLDLRKGGLEELSERDGVCDLMILSHVLEHLRDPIGGMKGIAAHIKPGGYLYIEVPSVLEVRGDVLRYFQSAHTYSFSPLTLRQTMAKAGWEMVAMSPFIRSLWRYIGIVVSAPEQHQPSSPCEAIRVYCSLVREERKGPWYRRFMRSKQMIGAVLVRVRRLFRNNT